MKDRPSPLGLFGWLVAGKPAAAAGLVACSVGVAAAELAIPWLLQEAIDAALGSRDAGRLDRIGLAILAVVAALYIVHALLLRCEIAVVQDGLFRLRRLLYSRVLGQPLAFFSKARTGDLMHRLVNDVDVVDTHASYLFSDVPFDLMTVVGVLAAMLLLEPRLALVIVVFLTVASLISHRLGRPLPTLRKRLQSAGAAFNARLQEVLSGVRTVKTFGREAFETKRLDAANADIRAIETGAGRIEALLEPVFDLIEQLGVVFIVWYGAHLLIEGSLTAGGLVAFIAYMELLSAPIGHIGKHYRHFLQTRAVFERLAEFLGGLAPVRVAGGGKRAPAAAPLIAFDGVVFDHAAAAGGSDEKASRRILDGLSLAIRPGETVALLGRNGSGKTTAMDLLLGFHAPQAGRVLIDGGDLAAIDPASWREAVGTMSQEVVLFHASVRDNIAYGRPEATGGEIRAAAEAAGLDALLARLPDGLETIVGDRGSKLSGGERQRIALARLFLKAPRVLILDEPAAHLDGEALRDLADRLAALAQGRTTILIEHRPELLALADRAVLLDGGRVAASGTVADLLAQEPLAASLAAEGKTGSGGKAGGKGGKPRANGGAKAAGIELVT
jgi:ABC-type multidrug transport system fused ATPase/permease subunit